LNFTRLAIRSGTPLFAFDDEDDDDVPLSSVTSMVLKICDGFGNIRSGIPSTKIFAAAFILDGTCVGHASSSSPPPSRVVVVVPNWPTFGAVVPDRDANGTENSIAETIPTAARGSRD
jgi:hypothetical protein